MVLLEERPGGRVGERRTAGEVGIRGGDVDVDLLHAAAGVRSPVVHVEVPDLHPVERIDGAEVDDEPFGELRPARVARVLSHPHLALVGDAVRPGRLVDSVAVDGVDRGALRFVGRVGERGLRHDVRRVPPRGDERRRKERRRDDGRKTFREERWRIHGGGLARGWGSVGLGGRNPPPPVFRAESSGR